MVVLMKIAGRANSGTPTLSGLAGIGFARCRRIAACCTITLGRDLKVHSGSPGLSEGVARACLSRCGVHLKNCRETYTVPKDGRSL